MKCTCPPWKPSSGSMSRSRWKCSSGGRSAAPAPGKSSLTPRRTTVTRRTWAWSLPKAGGPNWAMRAFDNEIVPRLRTELPGPRARVLLERDGHYTSPSYTRVYPLVVERGSGAVIEDVDGNLFLDFTAGIAVNSTGHCHPQVVAAIQDQAARLLHMSGTDFYYEPQIDLAQRLAEVAPGDAPKRVFFTNSGAEALEAALKLARWHT